MNPNSEKKRVLFVINPISGGKKKEHLPEFYRQNLDKFRYTCEIYWWEKVDELESKLKSFVNSGGWAVAAVGGDGTVSLVAKTIRRSATLLVIVPVGSGNGFARQLGIPRSSKSAIKMLNSPDKHIEIQLDTVDSNAGSYVNVCGIGFDADVANEFADGGKRGFLGYVIAVWRLYWKSKDTFFEVVIDGEKHTIQGFMLNIANGSQWGNDFHIAPKAYLNDGELDVVVVRKPKLRQIPSLIYAMRRSRLHPSLIYRRGKKILVSTDERLGLHLDGEPFGTTNDFIAEIQNSSLRVLLSKDWSTQAITA